MRRHLFLLAPLLLLSVADLAGQTVPADSPHAGGELATPPDSTTPAAATRPPLRRASVLAAEEIATASSAYADVFSLVRALRPRWLSTRGIGSITQPESIRVYLNGAPTGGPEVLRQVQARSVRRIEHLDRVAATTRVGTRHGNGAILVVTQ